MFDSWFETLFKFKLINYKEGEFFFATGDNIYLVILLLLLFLFALILIYFLTNIYFKKQHKVLSIILRSAALLLLFLPLFEPMILVPDVNPNKNYLPILIDNSLSMAVADGYYGETRFNDIKKILNDKNEGILSDLEEYFKIRFYKFSNDASRVDSIGQVQPEGVETNLTAALSHILSDFKDLSLSSILLFTDGADNGKDDISSVMEDLRNRKIPLHIVGLGHEKLVQDRELLNVSTNKQVLEGTGAEVQTQIRSWNKEDSPVALNIYHGEDLVHSEKLNLSGDGKIDNGSFFFEPDEKDATEYILQVASAENEVNLTNNSLSMLVDSKKDTIRILYFEGHLRSDFKFIKRALEDDPVLEFTSITRTGTGKYYRQGIYDVNELGGGFPVSEKDLYRFSAIIFGDIEAGHFSLGQLEMIEKFVRKRGGGFLMLGGLNSFAEGDYWNTPIADLLPVEINPKRRMSIQPDFTQSDESENEEGFSFVPTQAGLESPILNLATNVATNKKIWEEMPNLFSINYLGAVKPAATVLAEKSKDRFGDKEPLLTIQSYGKGKTAALATASTWRWQMLLDEKDSRHERFWRQFIHWLCTDAPNQVNINLAQERYEPKEEIPIRVSVYNKTYDPLSYADVSGIVTDPGGSKHQIDFISELNGDGEYVTTFVPNTPGIYHIEVTAEQNGEFIARQQQSFLSKTSKKELYNATLKRTFLEDLANTSNGIFYEPSQINSIPVNLKNRKSNTSVYRTNYLWDTPLLFLIVVVLLSAEWIYRRQKGLP